MARDQDAPTALARRAGPYGRFPDVADARASRGPRRPHRRGPDGSPGDGHRQALAGAKSPVDSVPPVDSALAVSGLGKRYGAKVALADVDLEVGRGELVGLLGPNGAGKSTLTKIACGLVRPSTGSAEVCGAPAGSAPARRALGYLAELFRFPGWSSADEVLALHQRLAGSGGGEGERAELLSLVGL